MSKARAVGIVAAGFLAMVGGWRLSAQNTGEPPLIAHEWGTFTALQDDDGTALGSINSDDEPVPDFVHRIGGVNALPSRPNLSPLLANPYSKGLVSCHPDVTMRLETPVIYFYPSENKHGPAAVDVRVRFNGGWLTEFYPQADADAPDLFHSANPMYPKLAASTTGSLAWNRMVLGAPGEPTATDDPVWTTPREVPRAVLVNAGPTKGEAADHPEKFLFYRGVGHIASPLRVIRNAKTDRLEIQADLRTPSSPAPSAGVTPDLIVPAAWLIEIRPGDGFCAFRPVPGLMDLHTPSGQQLASLPASFAPDEFSAGRLQELRKAMHMALVLEGLYPEEATAMLKTWELSYFQSPGRRLFYVTPRAWTDRVLPLSISGAVITRAMMGRIELITPPQREGLARLAAGPCPDIKAMVDAYQPTLFPAREAWAKRVASGTALPSSWRQPTLAEAGVAIPALYQDYINLGRFRDALVLREQRQRPTAALAEFVQANQLRAR